MKSFLKQWIEIRNTPSPKDFESSMNSIKSIYMQNPTPENYALMHKEMDEVLCDTLEALGYNDGVKVFRETGRKY